MDIAIMIEGQNGLNWDRWKQVATLVEELGFAGLYRSDHYTNAGPPDLDSLELWISLAWLADNTERIEFGPLVTPPSFRHPTMTARYATAVSDLSGGRLHLGLGGGWQEREHEKFGLPLLEMGPRFDRFRESVEVITTLIESDDPVDYEGEFYTLNEAILLPRPEHPPVILIGGNGRNKTLRYVARYATMWNGVFIPADEFKELNGILDGYLEEEGRSPGDVHRSLMTGLYFGEDEEAVQAKLDAHPRQPTREQLRERGVIVGAPGEVTAQLAELEEAGAQRVMLQWLDLDDMDGLKALAETVL